MVVNFTVSVLRSFGCVVGLAALAMASLLVGSAVAQQPGAPQVPREQLRTTGKVLGMRGPLMQLENSEGEKWVLQIEANVQNLSFTGSAEPGFLRPGMMVRFNAKINKRGDATEVIDQLILFTPRPGFELGVISTTDLGGGASNELFAGGEEAPKPAPVPKTTEIPTYQVSGQITKISRSGEMTIAAGSVAVKAKLDPDAKVSVDMADLSLVRPGDEATIEGWYITGRKGQGWANRVSISAKEPLADPKKKVRKTPAEAAEDAKGEEKPGDAKPADGEKPAEAKADAAKTEAAKTEE